MTRTLFLHLGPAKTGTSAVQHVLNGHDESVVCYPKVGLWPDGSHHNLVLNFFGNYRRPELIRQDADRLLARLGAAARQSRRNIVISSEALAGPRNLADFVVAVQNAVGEELRVVLVVVVREYFERAASLYNQRVKDPVTSERSDPDEFLTGQTWRFCYANFLRRLRSTGYELEAVNYHPADGCVARCLRTFGFPADRIPEAPIRNVSLSAKVLIALLAANRLAATPRERARLEGVLARMPNRSASSEMWFGRGASAKVQPVFDADREYLGQQFGILLPRVDVHKDRPFVLHKDDLVDLETAMRHCGAFGDRALDIVARYVAPAEHGLQSSESEPPQETGDEPAPVPNQKGRSFLRPFRMTDGRNGP